MTPEERETLTIFADCIDDELAGSETRGFTWAVVSVDRERYRALRAALAPPPTCGTWQSIETAPKGQTVLVWATFHEDYGYTERRDGMIRASFDGKSWTPQEATGQYWHGMTPRYWMPLPAAPTEPTR